FRGVALAPAIPITITPSAGAHGHISPATPQVVNGAGPHAFTVTADTNYSPLVGGTCAGTLVGDTYTTAPSSVSCTVIANTTLVTRRTVTPSASAHGTISPDSPQVVPFGASATFVISPAFGYSASVGGTCDGTLSGTIYTTNAVTTDCTVDAV